MNVDSFKVLEEVYLDIVRGDGLCVIELYGLFCVSNRS